MKRLWAFLFLGLVLCSHADAQAGARAHYAVNSEKSKLQISVFKEGLFKAFGHDHLVSAKVVSGACCSTSKRSTIHQSTSPSKQVHAP